MQVDKKLKCFLVLQSFFPLFLLIFIRHVGHCDLVLRFLTGIFHGDWSVFRKMVKSPALGDVVISFFSILWMVITVIVVIGFHNIQNSNFASHGETIIIESEKKDSGVTFLVTFLLPLLVDDVATLRGFLFFSTLLVMVILLLIRSDLFYQNPVLAALHYRIYEFKFCAPYTDVEENKNYIGMTRYELPSEQVAIKRKYIADNVFIIYND